MPTGTPVHAILDGEVVRVETSKEGSSLERFGKFVVIAHSGVVGAALRQTVYLHLSEFNVAVGDLVAKGDVIGAVGRSGVGINTEHLHFEYHIGVNDGKISRRNTRNPIRVLPYEKSDYQISAAKKNHALSIHVKEDDSATDLIGLKLIVDEMEEKEINFETRAGINIDNEDDNPYMGLTITPFKFQPSSDQYQLTFELAGDWTNAKRLDVIMLDARDSVKTVFFTF